MLKTGEAWERIMELIAKRVLPSLIYIGQFHILLSVVKSFETVKKFKGLCKMSFKSADFVMFHLF